MMTLDGRSHEHRTNVYAVDIVHVGFLQTYLDEHLMPFATDFSDKALKHHIELAKGRAFVPKMGAKWHKEVEPLMTPLTLAKRASGISSVAGRFTKGAAKESD